MSLKKSVKLVTGAEMPLLGLGTWKSSPGEVFKAVKIALETGYRHIDCAYAYENETEVGEAIKASGIPREEIFITGKLWNNFHKPEHVELALDRSLELLQLDYIDLYLIHWPCPMEFEEFYIPGKTSTGLGKAEKDSATNPDAIKEYLYNKDGSFKFQKDVTLGDTWKALEKMVEKGKAKSIGLSNFNESKINEILKVASIPPAVNQVELHPYFPQLELHKFCKENDIHLTAYAPLGSFGQPRVMEDPKINEIAKKNNASPAQVLLAWGQQRGITVIPKSVSEDRIKANFKDIELSQEDMDAISKLDKNTRFFTLFPVFD